MQKSILNFYINDCIFKFIRYKRETFAEIVKVLKEKSFNPDFFI